MSKFMKFSKPPPPPPQARQALHRTQLRAKVRRRQRLAANKVLALPVSLNRVIELSVLNGH